MVLAFPQDFRVSFFFQASRESTDRRLQMVAGSPTRDTYNASNFADQAVSFMCLGKSFVAFEDAYVLTCVT